ncbi:MAG: hypothetical protein V8T87_05995 [Victivallales bacterium]
MKFLQLTSVLSAMSVLFALPGAELSFTKEQCQPRYKAKVTWEGKDLILRTDTAEWDSGVKVNPVKGEKYLNCF